MNLAIIVARNSSVHALFCIYLISEVAEMTNSIMKKRNTDELISELIDLCFRLKETVEKEFVPLSKKQLFWSSDKNSWSIAQCLAHLNAFHRFYVPVFIERVKNTRFQEPDEFFQSSPLGQSTYAKVKLGKLKNVKRKLKSPKDYNPLINKNLKTENLLEDFIKYQNQLIETLENARSINIKKTKTSFSVRPIVKLRLGDAFLYIVYHCERHIEQAKKIKLHSKFPTS